MTAPEDIERLCQAFLKGSLTPLELQLLLEYLENHPHGAVFKKVMLNALQHEQYSNASDAKTKEDVYQSILYRIRQMDQKEVSMRSPPKQPRWWWMAAAILILAVGVGAFLRFQNRSSEKGLKPSLAYRIVPGSNKATLTLANGNAILLDSTTAGRLAQQGNSQVIKAGAGILEYKEQEEKANVSKEKPLFNTLSTPKGGEFQLVLPDGSKVQLNAASSIRFPTSFSGKTRVVEINGEAYFEIAQNSKKPFIVKKGKMEIEVLGTSFNVNAYDDESSIKVTLLEGKVKVANGLGQSAMLNPGEQAQVTKGISVEKDVSTREVVAWKNGKFQFNITDIHEIMKQISRWYDVEVEYKGTVSTHFWGSISRSVALSNVLEMLEQTGGVKFKLEGEKIIVMPQ